MYVHIHNRGNTCDFYEYDLCSLKFYANELLKNSKPKKLKSQSPQLNTIQFPELYPNQILSDQFLLDEEKVNITVKSSRKNYLLKINESQFFIDKENIQFEEKTVNQTHLLGPALILNLALNQVFCLHASAFKYRSKVFAIIGDSGVGKSTIARKIQTQQKAQRLADDILAIKIDPSSLQLFPEFPQLKLSCDQQPYKQTIFCKPKLFFISKSNETKIESVDPMSSIKKLINHTVAGKLFDTQLLKDHLSFCQTTIKHSECYNLHYAHDKDSLNTLIGILNDLV